MQFTWQWVTAELHRVQHLPGLTAGTEKGYVQLVLHSRCRGNAHRAYAVLQTHLNRAAMHLCWVTAHLYEEQISIGITAVKHCLL